MYFSGGGGWGKRVEDGCCGRNNHNPLGSGALLGWGTLGRVHAFFSTLVIPAIVSGATEPHAHRESG